MQGNQKLRYIHTLSEDTIVTKEFDPYILTVNIGKQEGAAVFYWRLIEPKNNLIEIGIAKDSGRLALLKIVLYNGPLYHSALKSEALQVQTSFGLPCFQVDLWRSSTHPYDIAADYYDFYGIARLEANTRELRIRLFEDEITSVTQNGPLKCEFNKSNELCALSIDGLTEEDYLMLKDCIEHKKNNAPA